VSDQIPEGAEEVASMTIYKDGAGKNWADMTMRDEMGNGERVVFEVPEHMAAQLPMMLNMMRAQAAGG
jgi:hypothetical protein